MSSEHTTRQAIPTIQTSAGELTARPVTRPRRRASGDDAELRDSMVVWIRLGHLLRLDQTILQKGMVAWIRRRTS